MNHYYVTIPEGCIKYYAPSEQDVKRVFPEATEITLLDDTILHISDLLKLTNKEKKLWKW